MSLTTLFTDIANAIRNKKGTTSPIKASDFATEIASIESGGGETPEGSSDNKLTLLLADQLEEVTAEDIGNITSTPEYSFYKKTKLKKVTLPSTIERIQTSSFDGCTSLDEINLSSLPNLLSLNGFAFRNTGIRELIVPPTVNAILEYCFYACNQLETLNITSLNSFGQYSFANCSNLKNVYFGSGQTAIPNYCFENCTSLVNLVLPDTLTTINNYAFRNCSQLAELTIPGSVTKINANAFAGCGFLRTVYCKASTPPTITATSLPASTIDRVYIPTGSLASYQANSYWNNNFGTKFIEIDM